ncbi:MAG: dTMP kinase [Candidatus Riflebacteria bacterium]|nr:dTMP kinase [Candidatus Riflebacteria bacterium]
MAASPRWTGFFLTFEGPEGSGKSTQIRRLRDHLVAAGRSVLLTREPGGTPFGDKIRALLLDPGGGPLEPATEACLMLAQRAEHLRQVIRPALSAGTVVLCDRYADSSLAYQGYARGLGADLIRELHERTLGDFLPDLTVLFDIDPAQGLERARHGGKKSFDRMESEAVAFHQKVRNGYLDLAGREPHRFLVIDAAVPPDRVFSALLQGLQERSPGIL